MTPIRHLFWDFDGTLYDSYPQLLHSVMAGLEDLGAADRFDQQEVLNWIKVNVYYGVQVCAEHLGLHQLLIHPGPPGGRSLLPLPYSHLRGFAQIRHGRPSHGRAENQQNNHRVG